MVLTTTLWQSLKLNQVIVKTSCVLDEGKSSKTQILCYVFEQFRVYILLLRPGVGEKTSWVNVWWVCATGFSDHQPYYSLFSGQL